ncbi:MAG: SDR family NAD(P)-dependent oxidoreductase [Burkholderiales bacterium]
MATGTELAGKVALITGAGKNIGRSIALELAAAGAAIGVNTRASKEDAEKVAQEIRGAGGKAEVFMADIVDPKAVQAMVDGVIKRFGRLDFLILNASVRKETPFADMSFDEWRSLISITLDGSFHCVKASLPHLIKAGGGAIVTLGGMQALSGAKRRVHGSVGKFGLYGMTRALAKELGEHKIRVNCVSPGQMNTPRAAGRSARPDAAATVPLGRLVEPDEIASTVRFLCSPGGAMISGQLIYVDGGQQMF